MKALEEHAASARFRLLTLDTWRGTPAEALYRGLGWSEAGIIPRFALLSDGVYGDTVLFYKELEA
jgi:hypothetical protein